MNRTMIFVHENHSIGQVGGLVSGCKCRFKKGLSKKETCLRGRGRGRGRVAEIKPYFL